MFTESEIFNTLDEGEAVFDIGQIDRKTLLKLNGLVKAGELIKEKVWWPYITWGTVKKNSYRKNLS